jgi:hypothetical protein
MGADGWIILSLITVACGYAFGVHVPKQINVRRRHH